MNREEILCVKYQNEDQMSAYFYQYVNEHYPESRGVFFHVPNGGSRNAKEGAKFKAMGTVAGVPDYVCLSPLFCVELKMPNGTLSQIQKKLHPIIQSKGVKLYTAYTMQQAIEAIEAEFGK